MLEHLRIANQYGLFAVMTSGRYEIEFQGSNDGATWTPYPFRNKPQALNEAPRIYAPYQPRFDWNLWFASLGDWRQDDLVPLTEERLLENDKDVLNLYGPIHFHKRRPATCAPFYGNTGSPRARKSAQRETGGEDNFLGSTHPYLPGRRKAGPLWSNGLTNFPRMIDLGE